MGQCDDILGVLGCGGGLCGHVLRAVGIATDKKTRGQAVVASVGHLRLEKLARGVRAGLHSARAQAVRRGTVASLAVLENGECWAWGGNGRAGGFLRHGFLLLDRLQHVIVTTSERNRI